MDLPPDSIPVATSPEIRPAPKAPYRLFVAKWSVVLLAAIALLLLPPPAGITPRSWHLLAIFVATIVGLIIQPLPSGGMVLLGVLATAFTGVLPASQALAGYADPIVWLVLSAIFIARGMMKTGLGRRIAFLFIRAIGRTSLGLGYALISTDTLLAMVIPSNGARAGGIIFPIAKSIAEAYQSAPGPTAGRLGAFLMILIYQCDVIVCAMFLTGQASNVLIAKFAGQITGVELTYGRWALGALVPGLLSLVVVPLMLYRLFPPEVKHTPSAAEFASVELKRLGPMAPGEKLMLFVFGLVMLLWLTASWHRIDYTLIGLLGIGLLLISGVLEWEDVLVERGAWDVFIWYGGVIGLAKALNETGITKWFAESAAHMTIGWSWGVALAILLLVYFYAHYGFASITAHASAMYLPFLVVILAAGTPLYLAVLSLTYFTNLDACLTHYGTTPGPIYYAAGYVKQRTWWRLGLIISIVHILIWSIIGFTWWKVLRWW